MRAATLNKHQLRTEATTQKLLDAASTVFARDGFEAARIEDIAAEAGFTRGAFYAHYNTKSDLFFDLLRHGSEEHHHSLHQQIKNARNCEERLEALRSGYLARVSAKQWCILLLEFKLYALRQGRHREHLAEVHRELRKGFKRWIGEYIGAEFAPEDEWEPIGAALEAALHGLVLERAYDPKRLTDAQVRDLLGKIFDALLPGRR